MSLAAPPRLPYPGLRSFRREESDLFFGRDACVSTMVDRLAATRFLAVLGSSGTGKSSLVKTGLIDALDLGLLTEAGSDWRVVDFTPGAAPMRNLAQRLIETEKESAASDSETEFLRAFLLRGPRAVAQWVAEGHLPPKRNLLLLVDQFEELFRFQDYAGREESEAFVALLIESARWTGSRIHVVITMRSEFLGACSLIDGLAEAIAAGLYLIPRMKRDQCREAIVGPATNCEFDIEPALVNRLLNDLAAFAPWEDSGTLGRLERLGRRADQLPLLQYCLNRMWVRAPDSDATRRIRLTLADYETIGALGGALDAHATEIVKALGEERRAVVEKVFRALTEGATATDAVRRPTRLGELVEICGGDEAAVRAVVDAFRSPGCNFLMPPPDPAHPAPLPKTAVVDISHESLIRQWKRFPAWLEAEARSARTWRRLTERFDDGDVLQANELANLRTWRKEEKPNAAWARRYGGDFDAAMAFIDSSERGRSKYAPAVMPLVGVAALIVNAILLFLGWVTLVSEKDFPPYLLVVFGSVPPAITCAFGLSRYRGVSARDALSTGATILLAEAASIGLLIYIYGVAGFAQGVAQSWWSAGLAAPIAVTAMAVFDPFFRRLSKWLALVAAWSTLTIFLSAAISINARGVFVIIGVWCFWCMVFGFMLRQPYEKGESGKLRPAPTALKLGAILASFCFLLIIWEAMALSPVFGANSDAWPQWTKGVPGAAGLALTLGVGLRKYRGFDARSAAWAAAAEFASVFVSAAVAFVGLTSWGLDTPAAQVGAAFIDIAPATLIVLSIFDRSFRRPRIWLSLLALFEIPYGLVVMLVEGPGKTISEANSGWAGLLVLTLWIAAIGYVFALLPPSEKRGEPPVAAPTNGALAGA